MNLTNLGYNEKLEKYRIENMLRNFEIGRIIAEHKERYIVKTVNGEFESEITGNMRFTANNREDFPVVGDWVALQIYEPDFALIYQILPRNSIIRRQAVGQSSGIQIVATNIDFAFIVQAVDKDFNINRLERYLTICSSSGIKSIIVLTKIDLITVDEKNEIIQVIHSRIKNIPVIALSNENLEGYEDLKNTIQKSKTYCLLGSSGVGKSTLLNNLSDGNIMKTNSISTSTGKGKHTTSHRELIILENGGILIDNPGMREVGIADSIAGLDITFNNILQYAQKCRFKDCTHIHEIGCEVKKAVEYGEIDQKSYENYIKLRKENMHFESSVSERRKKEKQFGKILKNYKKDIKRNKE